MNRKKIALILIPSVLLLAFGIGYRLTMPGALFLSRLFEGSGASPSEFNVRDGIVEREGRGIPLRVYRPSRGANRVVLLLHGVHHRGYDEKRLVGFAELLAAFGYVVVTPDIESLKTYEIASEAVKDIESSALWTLEQPDIMDASADGDIGIFGISFSGGLGLSASALPSIENRVRFVFAFGGHGDLKRTMTYLVTGGLPDGGNLKPHVYGQAVLARKFAPNLVAADQVESLRSVLLDYLKGNYDTVRERQKDLPEESKAIVQLCLKRDTETLGKLLEPWVRAHTPPTILSPVHGDVPKCPVFLLHGSVDNVIPPSETTALGRWALPHTDTTVLVSEAIKHVELSNKEEKPSWTALYRIIRFFTEMLRM